MAEREVRKRWGLSGEIEVRLWKGSRQKGSQEGGRGGRKATLSWGAKTIQMFPG